MRNISAILNDFDYCVWKLDSFAELDEEKELIQNLSEICSELREMYDDRTT